MNCCVKCDLGVTLSSQSEDSYIVTTDKEPFISKTFDKKNKITIKRTMQNFTNVKVEQKPVRVF